MAHINKDIDYVVTIFIVHNNRVLLVDHIHLGAWFAPGGHIELNETPDEALYREIQE